MGHLACARIRSCLLALVAASLAVASGCAHRQVIAPGQGLPLTRVVLYRNGIGYFERSGLVEGDRLRFQVRRENVGDFLATLAVTDSTGRAQSVSFPSQEPTEGEEPSKLVDVIVGLDGDERHDVKVAYVVEAAIWRPTYRVVLGAGEKARGTSLQGWAIVQNGSGEDWDDVRMSVTSGAPLSFTADLDRTVIPSRPMVTDSGEVVAAPVYSETTLSTDSGENVALAMEPAAEEMELPQLSARMAPSMAAPPSPDRVDASAPGGGAPVNVESLLSSMEPPAEGVRRGGNRYDVPGLVTVPASGSTMVSILDASVTGEDALLYRPDAAVPGSDTYPMRVLRLRNDTTVLLERGPVAIYEQDALLGQGLLAALPAGATTTIPFAVERGVAVAVERSSEQTAARLVRIARGRVTVEAFDQRSTRYDIQNGTDRQTTIYLRHDVTEGWDMLETPAGTERVDGAVLLPVALAPNRDASLTIVERTPVRTEVDFVSGPGIQAVGFYLEGAAIDAAAGPVLRTALERRDRLEEIGRLQQVKTAQREELRRAAGEVRTNLAALEGNRRAEELRDRLADRLADLNRRDEELTNEIVELEMERSELEILLSEALRELTLDVPQPAAR